MNFKEYLLLRESQGISQYKMAAAVNKLSRGLPVDPSYLQEPIIAGHSEHVYDSFFDVPFFNDVDLLAYSYFQKNNLNPYVICDSSMYIILVKTTLENLVSLGGTFQKKLTDSDIGFYRAAGGKVEVTLFPLQIQNDLLERGFKILSKQTLELALHGGKTSEVLLSLIEPEKFDYRPNEMTPEDFY